MSEKNTTNPQQIVVCKTNKVLVEALDRLKIADISKGEPYASLHGKYSRICLRMCNYGDKSKTTTMDFNIEPYLAGYFLTMFPCAIQLTEFKYTSDKMLAHKKNEDGTVLVTKLSITRSNVDKKGELRRNPWFIKVENGSGTPKNGVNGTSYFTNYKMNVDAVIALSDEDFYMLMSKISDYINVWVNTNCPKIIRLECERLEREFWDKQNQSAA